MKRLLSTLEPKTQWRQTFILGFDGAAFNGSAYLEGQRTVEGEVLNGLRQMGVSEQVFDFPRGCLLQRCSRVDKGVSAS